jgi:hypothetical protein
MGSEKGKIYKYDLEGNFIREFEHIEQCKFIDNRSFFAIKNSIDRKIHSTLDCIYTQLPYIKLPDELIHRVPRKKYQKPINYKPNINNEIPVYQYDLDGNFIKEYKSRSEAARQLNIDLSQIANCTRKSSKLKTAGNYQWSNKKLDKIEPFVNKRLVKISQYDLDGNFIRDWDSSFQAARELGLTSIRDCLRGKTKRSGKFIFKYATTN